MSNTFLWCVLSSWTSPPATNRTAVFAISFWSHWYHLCLDWLFLRVDAPPAHLRRWLPGCGDESRMIAIVITLHPNVSATPKSLQRVVHSFLLGQVQLAPSLDAPTFSWTACNFSRIYAVCRVVLQHCVVLSAHRVPVRRSAVPERCWYSRCPFRICTALAGLLLYLLFSWSVFAVSLAVLLRILRCTV